MQIATRPVQTVGRRFGSANTPCFGHSVGVESVIICIGIIMKIYSALAASVVLLTGCVNPYAVMRDDNRAALSSVEMGMGKSQVQSIMGVRSAEGYAGRFDNPYQRETLRGTDGATYEVLYYYTQQMAGKPYESGLSPVVLLDSKVVGIGWRALDGLTPQKGMR
jgi:hypothetical protein